MITKALILVAACLATGLADTISSTEASPPSATLITPTPNTTTSIAASGTSSDLVSSLESASSSTISEEKATQTPEGTETKQFVVPTPEPQLPDEHGQADSGEPSGGYVAAVFFSVFGVMGAGVYIGYRRITYKKEEGLGSYREVIPDDDRFELMEISDTYDPISGRS
eukprot:comp21053_c0_seq1/m.28319 comp21053_c0_seq1/g.28319  ORF comp21053_c0_seq1/g.28319 comp21053_c0_seq1/m.28319 type:complete len:168 (-) comp21053_c0_seq1:130-633(-)